MADSDLPDPEPTINNAADKAHDKIEELAPEDKKDQAHDAVDKGQDASDAAGNLADAAVTKAGPALDQAKSAYGKNPRRRQIVGAVIGTVLLVVLFRRTRTN